MDLQVDNAQIRRPTLYKSVRCIEHTPRVPAQRISQLAVDENALERGQQPQRRSIAARLPTMAKKLASIRNMAQLDVGSARYEI